MPTPNRPQLSRTAPPLPAPVAAKRSWAPTPKPSPKPETKAVIVSDAKAKILASVEWLPLQRKLKALSYGAKGQDPAKLFSHYDIDNDGELSFHEFKNAVRKGGHVGPNACSDAQLKRLFSAVDADDSGDVEIAELTNFIWGGDPSSPERSRGSSLADAKSMAGYVSPYATKTIKSAGADPDRAVLKTSTGPVKLSEAKAKVLASDEWEPLKRKLKAQSYVGKRGQDPKKLFSHYDRDNSGELEFPEFKNAVRKGGHVAPRDCSDAQLKKLFAAVDADDSGAVGIDELTSFIWGNQNLLREHGDHDAADHAAPPPEEVEDVTKGSLAMPSAAERHVAFDSMDGNHNGKLSLAGEYTSNPHHSLISRDVSEVVACGSEIDKAVVEVRFPY